MKKNLLKKLRESKNTYFDAVSHRALNESSINFILQDWLLVVSIQLSTKHNPV